MQRDSWGASYHLSYIGGADSQFAKEGSLAPSVPSITYHSIEGNVNLTENFLVRIGINNLFDKQPPYYTLPIDQNTDPFTYDLVGRRFFVKATYTF
jgi:outer membrane receptor protein involved in Fe transport